MSLDYGSNISKIDHGLERRNLFRLLSLSLLLEPACLIQHPLLPFSHHCPSLHWLHCNQHNLNRHHQGSSLSFLFHTSYYNNQAQETTTKITTAEINNASRTSLHFPLLWHLLLSFLIPVTGPPTHLGPFTDPLLQRKTKNQYSNNNQNAYFCHSKFEHSCWFKGREWHFVDN